MLKKRLGSEVIGRDWRYSDASDYFKIPTTIIIPDGCKRVGNAVFRGCHWLKKVMIPGSVEEIGVSAFDWCSNAVVILKKPMSEFKRIGEYAFWECRDVKEETRT